MGMKEHRFQLLQNLDKAMDEGRPRRGVNYARHLLKDTLPDMDDESLKKELKEFEKKQRKLMFKYFERAEKEAREKFNVGHRRRRFKRRHRNFARERYIVRMHDKLLDALTEKKLIPE